MKNHRLRNDTQGVTVWSIIGVLLVIVVGWQLVAPFVGIPTPYDLLTPDESEIWSETVIIDLVSGQQYTFYGTGGTVNMIQGHSYDAIIRTNAPWLWDKGYRIAWRLDFYNTTASAVQTLQSQVYAMPFSAIWSDSWDKDIAVDNYQIQYWFAFNLYNPDGMVMYNYAVEFIPPP